MEEKDEASAKSRDASVVVVACHSGNNAVTHGYCVTADDNGEGVVQLVFAAAMGREGSGTMGEDPTMGVGVVAATTGRMGGDRWPCGR